MTINGFEADSPPLHWTGRHSTKHQSHLFPSQSSHVSPTCDAAYLHTALLTFALGAVFGASHSATSSKTSLLAALKQGKECSKRALSSSPKALSTHGADKDGPRIWRPIFNLEKHTHQHKMFVPGAQNYGIILGFQGSRGGTRRNKTARDSEPENAGVWSFQVQPKITKHSGSEFSFERVADQSRPDLKPGSGWSFQVPTPNGQALITTPSGPCLETPCLVTYTTGPAP